MKRILEIIGTITNNVSTSQRIVEALNNNGFTIRENIAESRNEVDAESFLNVPKEMHDLSPEEYVALYLSAEVVPVSLFPAESEHEVLGVFKAGVSEHEAGGVFKAGVSEQEAVGYLFPDSRCGDCTRYTPDEIKGLLYE